MNNVSILDVYNYFSTKGFLGAYIIILSNEQEIEFVTENYINELSMNNVNFMLYIDILKVGLHNTIYESRIMFHFKNEKIYEHRNELLFDIILNKELNLITDEDRDIYNRYTIMKSI